MTESRTSPPSSERSTRRPSPSYDELHAAISGIAGEWELTTLEMGRRFEQMAIDFWTDVAERARQGRAAPIKPRR